MNPRFGLRLRRPTARTLRRGALLAVLAVAVPLLAAGVALRLEYTGDPSGAGAGRDRNAVWLGHAWVDGERDGTDLDALARRLRGSGTRDLYVHTGPLEFDGRLDAGLHPGARDMIRRMHTALPGVRVQAWLGQVLSHDGSEGLHLDDPATRDRIRDSAAQVLAAGFDGVHLDLEPMYSGDRILTLLKLVHRLTAARDVPLSVATHQMNQLPSLHTVGGALFHHPKWWSQRYFGEVARHRGPGSDDDLRHRAAPGEPLRRLRRPADGAGPGGDPGGHGPAHRPAPATTRTAGATTPGPRPSRPPCGAPGWAWPVRRPAASASVSRCTSTSPRPWRTGPRTARRGAAADRPDA